MAIPFTPDGYRSILKAASEAGYDILPMRDALGASGRQVMLLRHDVDMSLAYAHRMANLEREIGVRSTYFILPFNDFYNPLSQEGRRSVRAIHELGHEIGLHWDSSLYSPEPKALAQSFRRDLDLLVEVIGEPVVSASQHEPIETPMFDAEQLGVLDAYSPRVREQFSYVSDSTMKWRAETPFELIAQGAAVHFLAHPIWWFGPDSTMSDKILSVVAERSDELRQRCDDYIGRLEARLANRKEVDAKFEATRGWSRES